MTFRKGDEGTWQKYLEWYSQNNIVHPYPPPPPHKYVSDILLTEEAFTMEEYKHTNTHSHFNKSVSMQVSRMY